MRSELFRIPVELGGVPVLGFGVLLAAWLVVGGVLLARRYAQSGADADFWGWAQPVGVGALVIALVPRLAPLGVPIRGYGVMLLIAISTGVAMAVHRARRHGIDADTIFSLVFWLFVAGISGARAFYVIEYWETRFAGQPPLAALIDVLKFTEGGLVVYGSVIGGFVAFVGFVWKRGLPMLGMADILAPCFLVGLAIGRVGCLLNGCCYGGVCELPWAVTFPEGSPPFQDQLVHGGLHGLSIVEDEQGHAALVRENKAGVRLEAINGEPLVSDQGEPSVTVMILDEEGKPQRVRLTSMEQFARQISKAYNAELPLRLRAVGGEVVTAPAYAKTRSLPVHPTQLYSTVNAALTAWLLWNWFPHRRRDGEVALLMFTIYPVSRFLLEVIRTDESAIFGTGLSISQNVSLGVLVLASVGWVLLSRTPRGQRLAEVLPPAGGTGRTAPAGAA